MNQTPIIRPTTRAGASLVMALKPTGLRHSSQTVWSKYVAHSHRALTWMPVAARIAPTISTTYPRPTNINPRENFAGVDGFFGPKRSQTQPSTGASVMMNSEFTAWNQLAG